MKLKELARMLQQPISWTLHPNNRWVAYLPHIFINESPAVAEGVTQHDATMNLAKLLSKKTLETATGTAHFKTEKIEHERDVPVYVLSFEGAPTTIHSTVGEAKVKANSLDSSILETSWINIRNKETEKIVALVAKQFTIQRVLA